MTLDESLAQTGHLPPKSCEEVERDLFGEPEPMPEWARALL